MKGSFFRTSFSENGKRRHYYLLYTVVFFVVAFFCYSWFVFSGKSLIWEGDGWAQHFKALVYYGNYLRRIFKNLLRYHRLIIQDWDFYIGEGSDILNAMHYYVIGDPIALLSVFVPTHFMHHFYSFSCILRLYLSGAAFSELCFGTGQKNRYGILAGSTAYCFCAWSLTNAARHPYFLNPMIYFPFMILGIEKIIRKEKPYMFIVSAAISAASNFYFFYIIVLLAVLYAVIRLVFIYGRDVKKGVLTLLHLGVMAVIGVCIAGIMLLPVLMIFLRDSRLSVSMPFHWLYPLVYYSKLPSMAISENTEYWLYIGLTPPVILSIIVLFLKKKEDRFLKVLFAICLAIMLLPIGGRIFNGMSYMSNRWSWAFSLLCVYILVRKWDDLISLSGRQWIRLAIISAAYYAVCLLFDKSRTSSTFASISMLFLGLIVVKEDFAGKNNIVRRQILLLLLVSLGVINVAFWKFSPGSGKYVSEFIENRKVLEEWENNEAKAVSEVSDQEFTRMSGRSLTYNANIFNKISSTQYFWTISNPYVNNFRTSLNFIEPTFFNYMGYDDRTTPLALSAVNYYSVKSDDTMNLPYGFTLEGIVDTDESDETQIHNLKTELGVDWLNYEQIEKILEKTTSEYLIYKNQYSLPLAYCYDSYFVKDVWDSYNPVQKQEVQLEAAYVDGELDGIKKVDPEMPDYLVTYDLEMMGTDISQQENCFVTTADNTQIQLTLNHAIRDAETYVGFSGLDFSPTPVYDLYFGDESVDPLKLYNKTNWNMLSRNEQISIRKDKLYWDRVQDVAIEIKNSQETKKSFLYKQPDSNFSSGRHDFILNLGYTEDPVTTITITFPSRGIYTFKSLDVYGIPVKGFEKKIKSLGKNTLKDIRLGTDSVRGKITLSSDKLLCLATPFSTGWKAYIDGHEAEVHCVNERYPGIVVPKGTHKIRFRYHMPFKKEGFFVTLFGVACFILLLIFDYKKKKAGKPGEDPGKNRTTGKRGFSNRTTGKRGFSQKKN